MDAIVNKETSYAGILSSIKQKIESVNTCETLTGNELLGNAYKILNESSTPILDLKEFTTNAEKISGDDATLCDIVKFCKSKVKSGDLNFLINLCKEEHFKEMNRCYHPSPESTIKDFEVMFTESPTVIEQGIKNGIFDSMKSNLLGVLKKEINEKEKQQEPKNKIPSQNITKDNLNESVQEKNNLLKYSPIGVRFEDSQNRVVHLMENNVLSFNNDDGTVHCLNESEINDLDIPSSYRRLMTALTSLKYNPVDESFTLNENWDFNLVMRDGTCTVNGNEIPLENMKQLLLESVQCYESIPGKVKNFNKLAYMRDADNMVMLVENYDKLLKYDNLEIIKNLNESSYIIFDRRNTIVGSVPQIVAVKSQNDTEGNKLFESFTDLNKYCDSILNESIGNLFSKQINAELNIERERNEQLSKLNEDIKELNIVIKNAEDVLKIAEKGSAAYKEMNFKLSKLNESLREKLEQVNFYQHDFGRGNNKKENF